MLFTSPSKLETVKAKFYLKKSEQANKTDINFIKMNNIENEGNSTFSQSWNIKN
jgi:hypothetical protein